ncbi:bifunctional ADP-dependent NAD(P)H-hydrate dehydratase/NAD(P)H-hydrate epimerase [Gemmobacter aquarius]|uniref:Bifunctional NAD(P)H-hydrate repair enzyme n=2 Tax=Paragemmobacter aquarius TaxID=2169400 RepID=A0A2S0URA2_9RHOB|nr:bifunctional ADP-dependent NAD(P)H-hydrate dehydratase/NAD(P)H-hydrate epimerase [Gemmobacter aquarius]
MRGVEAAAIAAGKADGLALMERAGRGVVEAVRAHWPDLAWPFRAVVLCGPGNNGGDGYVIARVLREAGCAVEVYALAPAATPDAAEMAARWGGGVAGFGALGWEAMRATDVVFDAVFGTGLARDIAPGVWGALVMAQEAGARLVAVDMLSGLDADTGAVRAAGGFVDHPAGLTVTFQAEKLGHHLAAGGELSGPVVVVDIGLGAELEVVDGAVEAAEISVERLRKGGGHKFDHGHALVLAGGAGRGGAARLAAYGALRVGAGLVTVGCPAEALGENAARLDAVMLRVIEDGVALREALVDRRIRALCMGPGLGVERAAGMLGAVGGDHPPYAVLDADALTALTTVPFPAALRGRAVLTPHSGEFARVWPDLAGVASKVEAVRAAAARVGAVVLLKGADTLVAHPDGRCVLHSARGAMAAPWLATAGSGDVLAGIITGLLARGWSPFEAAETGAWLHAAAARRFGAGLIAEDLPEALPGVFRDLGL